MAEPKAVHLAFEVGILTAGNFEIVNFGAPRLKAGFKFTINGTHVRPIIRQQAKLFLVDSGVVTAVGQGRDDGVHVGLRGQPAHGAESRVNNVNVADGRHDVGRHAVGCGIMGVEMNRHIHFIFKRADEISGRDGFTQGRHVFDGQNVRAGLFDFMGHLDVIVEVVFRF